MRRLLRTSATLAALTVLFSLHPKIAAASSKVSSPDVTKGQVELEYRGGYDWDDDTEKQDQQESHKFCVNYGITDRWRMESKLVAGGRDDDLDWTTLEYSNRYQLLKDKEGWLKFSLQANYKFSLVPSKPDKLELTALAAKDTGPFTHITNINFENELGHAAHGSTDINLGWKTKYRWKPYLEPGGEFYADFGKMSDDNVKKFQIGPTIGGKVEGTGFKYDLGYLFGLNHNVADGRAKLILTYAFKP